MFFPSAWKQRRCLSGCGQCPEDCSRRTDQQWQQLGGSRTCWVGDVVRAVDFAHWNGDVSGWTVGRSERRGTEVHDHSDIGTPCPPASTLLYQNVMLYGHFRTEDLGRKGWAVSERSVDSHDDHQCKGWGVGSRFWFVQIQWRLAACLMSTRLQVFSFFLQLYVNIIQFQSLLVY